MGVHFARRVTNGRQWLHEQGNVEFDIRWTGKDK